MHGLAQDVPLDGGAVEAALADHYDMTLPRSAVRPRAIKARAETGANALYGKPQRLAGHRHETFDAQHVVRLGHGFQARKQSRRIGHFRNDHHEALEVVMFMGAIERVVVRWT